MAAICTAVLRWLLGKWGIADTSTPAQIVSLVCFVLIGYAAGRWLPSQPSAVHTRGALLEEAPRRRAKPGSGVITLAGVAVPPADETKHFKFIGTTGTGKSTAIREVLEGALERGDRAVIADPDGAISRASSMPTGAM